MTVVLAARALGFPVAMVNILDEDTQHTISVAGLGAVASIPREESLCQAVIASGDPVVSADTATDERFASLPRVVDGTVGSYVGVPLLGREAAVVGVLCVIDAQKRAIEPGVVTRLLEFGKIIEDQLDLMRLLDSQRRDIQVATSDLVEAIELNQIVPWYQPIIELSSGRLRSFEALASMGAPLRRSPSPKEFRAAG